ncbi:unnamed protein product [Schistosoma turkestanicum]|nr:unnamed protein product [Schistosoma turkestanicum]
MIILFNILTIINVSLYFVNSENSTVIQPVIYGGLQLIVNQNGKLDFMKPEIVQITSQTQTQKNNVQPHEITESKSPIKDDSLKEQRHMAQNYFFRSIQIPDSLIQFLLDRFVSIRYTLHNRFIRVKPRHLCGGLLITNDWVLTAAHCLSPFQSHTENLQVAKLHQHKETTSIQFKPDDDKARSVETIILHPNFTQGQNLSPDIGLLRLKHHSMIDSLTDEVYNYEDLKSFLFINDKSLLIDNSEYLCLIAGVGHLKYRDVKNANSNNYFHVAFVHLESCDKLWTKMEFDTEAKQGEDHVDHQHEEDDQWIKVCRQSLIDNTFSEKCPFSYLCAGGRYVDGDTCQGDSGGPLLCIESKHYLNYGKKWFVAGIASSGIQCGLNGIPSIYAPISAYLSWIESIIG